MDVKGKFPAEFVDEMVRDIRKLVAKMPGEEPSERLVGFLTATLAAEGCDRRAALHKLAATGSAIAGDHVHVTVMDECGASMTAYGPYGVAVQIPAPEDERLRPPPAIDPDAN